MSVTQANKRIVYGRIKEFTNGGVIVDQDGTVVELILLKETIQDGDVLNYIFYQSNKYIQALVNSENEMIRMQFVNPKGGESDD